MRNALLFALALNGCVRNTNVPDMPPLTQARPPSNPASIALGLIRESVVEKCGVTLNNISLTCGTVEASPPRANFMIFNPNKEQAKCIETIVKAGVDKCTTSIEQKTGKLLVRARCQ